MRAKSVPDGASCPGVHSTGWLDLGTLIHIIRCRALPSSRRAGRYCSKGLRIWLRFVVSDVGDCRDNKDVSDMRPYGDIVVLKRHTPMGRERLAVLQRWLGDAQLRARMVEGAVRVTEELLTWDRLIQQTLRFDQSGDNPA